jgi:hypothetical protein
VRDCRGTDAACGYMGSASGHGALTLICPVSGVSQVLGADRLKSLRVRNGTLVGECSSGSWGRTRAYRVLTVDSPRLSLELRRVSDVRARA